MFAIKSLGTYFCGLALASASLTLGAESLVPIIRGEPLGTYSTMSYGRAEGYDGFMGGVEITVTKGVRCSSCKIEHFVILQCAQGFPGVPSVFPASVQNGKLTFSVKANGQSEHRSGSGLALKHQHGAQKRCLAVLQNSERNWICANRSL